MLGNKVTTNFDLEQVARLFLGKKFKGVYARDNLPTLTRTKPYAIINTDLSSGFGVHWIALTLTPKKDILVYDSYGQRYHKEVVRELRKKYKKKLRFTEKDLEQKKKEDNCGQRTLAFLLTSDQFGTDIAKWI